MEAFYNLGLCCQLIVLGSMYFKMSNISLPLHGFLKFAGLFFWSFTPRKEASGK
jgi:hypothetical protein